MTGRGEDNEAGAFFLERLVETANDPSIMHSARSVQSISAPYDTAPMLYHRGVSGFQQEEIQCFRNSFLEPF